MELAKANHERLVEGWMITAPHRRRPRFEVRRSAAPHLVQITVDRGGELVLIAPEGCRPT
jgi:ribosomal protein L18